MHNLKFDFRFFTTTDTSYFIISKVFVVFCKTLQLLSKPVTRGVRWFVQTPHTSTRSVFIGIITQATMALVRRFIKVNKP